MAAVGHVKGARVHGAHALADVRLFGAEVAVEPIHGGARAHDEVDERDCFTTQTTLPGIRLNRRRES